MRVEVLEAACNEDADASWAGEFVPDDVARARSMPRWLDEVEAAVHERMPDGPRKPVWGALPGSPRA